MKNILFISITLILFSCVKYKNLLILNGEIKNKTINLSENQTFKYENDIIEILLISENKEASELFKTKFGSVIQL